MEWLTFDFVDAGNVGIVPLQDQVSPSSQSFSAVDFNTKLLDARIWKEITGKSHVPGLGPQLTGKEESCVRGQSGTVDPEVTWEFAGT